MNASSGEPPSLVTAASPVESLYAHVPFCAKKCSYCAFYSEADGGGLVDRYVDALIREFEIVAEGMRPRTLFFGGGTPSLLSMRQWETILNAMRRLNLTGAAEWTVESNPATVSFDKARLLRDAGVNRMSMGAQSFHPGLLARLGRVHSRDMIFKSYDILRAAGIENVSIDLMFAIPGQTMEMWRQTLAEAIALGCEHLSCYELIYEEDTPFFERLQVGRSLINEDLACAMYEELLASATAAGFAQYEVANFARIRSGETGEIPQLACSHNVNYWRGGWYHGLGPSAAAYVHGARSKNQSNTVAYCESLERGERAFEYIEELPPLRRAGELAAFGLRMAAGWPLELFKRRTGFDLTQEWSAEIERLSALGYASLEPDRFRLTQKGLRFADWAAELFLR